MYAQKLCTFLNENNYLHNNIKGFCSGVDDVMEHTELLSHILLTAKREQRSICITLLDLRNAFGLIQHSFIRSSLRYHHVPQEFIDIFDEIYNNSKILVSLGDNSTNPITVGRGVLQGDPASPFLFNVCMNTFLVNLQKPELSHLCFSWGTANQRRNTAWLQYADDAVVVAPDIRSAQQLISIFESWCGCAKMSIRLDKCVTLGMQKRCGRYVQFKPNLSAVGGQIPTVEIGGKFTYLGRIFDLDNQDNSAKIAVIDKLNSMIKITDTLKVKAQT